ncbi:MAG: Rieske (2Fe-2S) protein [Limnohabitans sp.]|jgi:nitrite reductase/ring-hydroxylating ferredoxin subunit
MTWQTLCPSTDIPEGQVRGFDPLGTGQSALLVLHWQGQWRAWQDWCPHWQTGPMAWRRHAYWSGDRQALVCHAHGARFDPLSGVCTLGPCLGQSLRPLALRLGAQGQIEVDLAPLIPQPEPTP